MGVSPGGGLQTGIAAQSAAKLPRLSLQGALNHPARRVQPAPPTARGGNGFPILRRLDRKTSGHSSCRRPAAGGRFCGRLGRTLPPGNLRTPGRGVPRDRAPRRLRGGALRGQRLAGAAQPDVGAPPHARRHEGTRRTVEHRHARPGARDRGPGGPAARPPRGRASGVAPRPRGTPCLSPGTPGSHPGHGPQLPGARGGDDHRRSRRHVGRLGARRPTGLDGPLLGAGAGRPPPESLPLHEAGQHRHRARRADPDEAGAGDGGLGVRTGGGDRPAGQ